MALLQVTGVFLAGGSKVGAALGFEGQPGDPWAWGRQGREERWRKRVGEDEGAPGRASGWREGLSVHLS